MSDRENQISLTKFEKDELIFLRTRFTNFSFLQAVSLQKKGMVTIKHCFSNASHNAYDVDITDYGREVADALIAEGVIQ